MYIEMSRDPSHGGGTWGFTNCVWSPTRKRDGHTWAYWEKINSAKEGDIVFHLRGKQPDASFIGFSYVSGNGFITNKRPPQPGEWNFSQQFFRADLTNFTPFHKPINLRSIFEHKQKELTQYFTKNKSDEDKKNLFFVIQNGQLQCLNGAYFSDLDEELFDILFDIDIPRTEVRESKQLISIETSTQLSIINSRIGQSAFSEAIKKQYNRRCCFPGCNIDDERLLVASHIARWSDNEALRGNLGNGLCFCILHDKAFEIGIFTLDDQYRIFVNPREISNINWLVQHLVDAQGTQIKLAQIRPLDDALLEHWTRVDIDPIINPVHKN
jgi:hypothetical protein